MTAAASTALVFRALADPTRLAVFERLIEEERTVGALAAGAGVSQPAVSQHLAVLRSAGLVTERRQGRFTHYRADPRGLEPLADWIGRYRAFWAERIDRMKSLLEEMEP